MIPEGLCAQGLISIMMLMKVVESLIDGSSWEISRPLGTYLQRGLWGASLPFLLCFLADEVSGLLITHAQHDALFSLEA